MDTQSNIQPFCLLNGKLQESLFDYNEDEIDAFHKTVTPDVLHEVYDAVEEEYNIQTSSKEAVAGAEVVTKYLNTLSSDELEVFSTYLTQELNASVTSSVQNNTLLDTHSIDYSSPRVDMLEGYIAISSSNLQALEKFRNKVTGSGSIQWEHRIKKHGDVTIHSYVFNIKEDSK